MENIVEATKGIEEVVELGVSQEEAAKMLDEFMHLIWDCSQLETMAEKEEYAKTHKPKIFGLLFKQLEELPENDDEWTIVDIMLEEALIMFSRTLTRGPESFRSEIYDFFIKENEED